MHIDPHAGTAVAFADPNTVINDSVGHIYATGSRNLYVMASDEQHLRILRVGAPTTTMPISSASDS